ncbi:UDP-4-amino-4-deoxy-L-arabinose--oxoglutarate aminotransferase, partial [Dysosmobacter welbionis]
MRVHLFRRPHQPLAVLRHLQCAGGHAACVHRLAGRHDHPGLLHQEPQRVVGGGHVRHLNVVLHAVGRDLLRLLHVHVVLHGRGHHHIRLHAPGLLTGEEFHAELLRIVLYPVAAAGAHLHQIRDLLLRGYAVRIIDISVRAGQCHHLGPQLRGLLTDAPGHVAEARAGDGLARDPLSLVLQHVLEIVYRAVARGLRPDQAAAVRKPLARQHTVLPGPLQPPVLAEEIPDLPAAHAHVPGGHVHIRPDVPVQRLHVRLAEPHDLRVRLPRRVEVRAALAAADGQARQGVLEDLLKAQEFDDAGIHVGLEPQAALVGPQRAVELAPVADVRVPLAPVILPGHPEGEHPLRLHHPVQQVHLLILRVLLNHRLQRGEHLL